MNGINKLRFLTLILLFTSTHVFAQYTSRWWLDALDSGSFQTIKNSTFYRYSEGEGVHIYVLDSGINSANNQFFGRIGEGVDVFSDDDDPEDCRGHGTQVASAAASEIWGVAKSAIVHPVKVAGCSEPGNSAHMVRGLQWILNNAERPAVVNISKSIDSNGELPAYRGKSLNQAVRDLIDAGILVVVAAGNQLDDACNYSPQSVIDALVVGAINEDFDVLSSSNFGECIDIWAPGENILVADIGSASATSTRTGSSFSAPIAAGVAAMILENSPSMSPEQLTDRILDLAKEGVGEVPGLFVNTGGNTAINAVFLDFQESGFRNVGVSLSNISQGGRKLFDWNIDDSRIMFANFIAPIGSRLLVEYRLGSTGDWTHFDIVEPEEHERFRLCLTHYNLNDRCHYNRFPNVRGLIAYRFKVEGTDGWKYIRPVNVYLDD